MLEKIKRGVSYLRTLFLDCLFPIECLICGQGEKWICDDCLSKIKINQDQVCPVCNRANQNGEVCPACKPKTSLEGVMIACDYNDKTIAKLIKSYKYKFIQDLGVSLSGILNRYLKDFADIVLADTIIIPVPLHKKRKKWRGFNQAELLSRGVACHFDLEISTCLAKIKHTQPQAKLDREGRLKNVVDCYKWIGENIEAKNIILIDDVTTTGATLNECAKELKAHGAKNVWGLVIAKN